MTFLNGIFEDSGEPLVESVQILNPFIEKDALTDKMSILDIRACTQAQTIVNIEIQVRQTGEMRERSLYYWPKRYQSQLKAGDTDGRLHRVVVINVLNFVEIDHPGYHNVFHIRSQAGLRLTDHLAMHFLELPKLRETNVLPKGALVRWLFFVREDTRDSGGPCEGRCRDGKGDDHPRGFEPRRSDPSTLRSPTNGSSRLRPCDCHG